MRALTMVLSVGLSIAPAHAQIGDPISSCTILVDPVEFGDYSTISRTPTTSSGRVELRCGGNVITTEARVTLSAGTSGRFQERTMLHGADRLIYNLYTDPGRQMVAGDGTQGTSILIPSPAEQSLKRFRGGLLAVSNAVFRIYGKIEPSQSVAAGEYTDTIQVIVEF
jgi:spore coat protein U-like protein